MIENTRLLFLLFHSTIVSLLWLWHRQLDMAFALFLLLILEFYVFHCRYRSKLYHQLNKLHNEARGRDLFLSITSHELRNPMTIIYSSVDLLEQYLHHFSVKEKSSIFNGIRRSIWRMTKIMDDIVLIGKFQHHQIPYCPRCINIFLLCSMACESLELGKYRQRIRMIFDYRITPMLNIDPSLVELILRNLLSNALKYSTKTVCLYVKLHNNTLIFDVIDHGIGIPENEVQNLTQLFSRASNTGKVKGLGVGLFLVANCVKLHHGTMKVHTKEHQGTHFRVAISILNP